MPGITDPTEEYFKNGLWAWVTNQWKKLTGDDAGHLQVDVVESGLPSGAATSAKQDTLAGHVDGVEGLLAGGLPSALDADGLKVKEQSPLTGFATSAHQTTMITALQLIDDLRAALNSVATDELDVVIDGQSADVEIKQTAPADLTPGIMGWDGSAWRKLPMLWGYSDTWAETAAGTASGAGNAAGSTAAIPAGSVYVLEAFSIWHNAGANKTLSVIVVHGAETTILYNNTAAVTATWYPITTRVTLKAGDVITGTAIAPGDGKLMYLRIRGYKMKVAE